ncbi:MAG: hypothetical protein ACFCU2_11420 [Acidimicrobiia bacterium]
MVAPVKRYSITRLGRPFDLSRTSNRISLLGPAVVGLGSLGWDLAMGDTPDYVGALWASITAFLAWAAARELDPDRPQTATLAMVLAAMAAVTGVWDVPLGVSAAALLGLRVLAGTVGGDLKPVDLVVIVGLAVFSGTRIEGWVVVLLLVLGVLDSRPPGYLFAFPAMVVGAGVGAYLAGVGLPGGSISDQAYLWALVTVVAIPLAVRRTKIRSRTDIFDHEIRWPNVRAARVMTGFVVVGGLLASTANDVVLLVPVLAALVATALIRTFRPL